MDAMPISKSKAQCLSVMGRVRTLGFLKDATTITGDIVAPATTRDWNGLK